MNAIVVKLLLLLVAVSYSNGRLYQTMRTNEAREKAAEDHSLSRFMGSKRAMGDDIEQLADLVYTDKRGKPCNSVRKNELAAYLNMDPKTPTARKECRALDCHCGTFSGPCNCRCT